MTRHHLSPSAKPRGYYEGAQDWIPVSFNPSQLKEVHEWVNRPGIGKYSLSIMTIRFENPKDATFFRLMFKE